jgi:hypothetical protein
MGLKEEGREEKRQEKHPTFSQRTQFPVLSTEEQSLKGRRMRIRSVNYWINIISAERSNSQKNIKQPNNTEDLLNYQIAQYYVTKVNNNQSKVA